MSSSRWKRVNVKVHFATLIEVIMTTIEFGMDSAPEVCEERVRSLRREYKKGEKGEKKVPNLLVEDIKHRGGGEPERAGTLFAGAGRSVGPRGAPELGSVSPALSHSEKERLNRNCSTDSRSWFSSQMPYDIFPQNTTIESTEARVSDTSHLTRPAEIQNSLALAKSAADRAVPCRKGDTFSAGKTRFRSSRRTVAGQF